MSVTTAATTSRSVRQRATIGAVVWQKRAPVTTNGVMLTSCSTKGRSSVTDIPAALRTEIEAMASAAWDDCPQYEPEWNEAVAALCAKVEALMLRAAYVADETAWGMPGAVADLLNEEPKDGDDG
jgi:hypothetical protein